MQGRIIEMYIARRKDAAVEAVAQARLLPGQGIEGDRYCKARQEELFGGSDLLVRESSRASPLPQVSQVSSQSQDVGQTHAIPQEAQSAFRWTGRGEGVGREGVWQKVGHIGPKP